MWGSDGNFVIDFRIWFSSNDGNILFRILDFDFFLDGGSFADIGGIELCGSVQIAFVVVQICVFDDGCCVIVGGWEVVIKAWFVVIKDRCVFVCGLVEVLLFVSIFNDNGGGKADIGFTVIIDNDFLFDASSVVPISRGVKIGDNAAVCLVSSIGMVILLVNGVIRAVVVPI